MQVPNFGNSRLPSGYPSPSRYNGILGLERNLEIIYGAQLLTVKIFKNKKLVPWPELEAAVSFPSSFL